MQRDRHVQGSKKTDWHIEKANPMVEVSIYMNKNDSIFSTHGTDHCDPPQPLAAGFFSGSSSIFSALSEPLSAGFASLSVLTAPSLCPPQPLPAGCFSFSALTALSFFDPQPLPA
jgi:hypothetical protein